MERSIDFYDAIETINTFPLNLPRWYAKNNPELQRKI